MFDQAAIDVLRHVTIPDQSHLIDGRHVEGQSGERLDVISPIDGQVFTTIENGNSADVDAAVSAARRSFDSGVWRDAPPAHRKKVLQRLAELIEKHALELAVLGIRDNGTEINMAYKAEPLSAAGTFAYYAGAVDKVYGEIAPTEPGTLGLIHREPVGVVGAIVPWNFPLMIAAWKLAPALAVGNSVVLKPSEVASLSLLRVAELALEAGLPPGVLNVVTGDGVRVGEAMGLHNDIDILVFTGSGGVGRKLLEYSARSNLKRCYLELGGKSPNIVFADAPDLDQAARVSAFGIFRNSGQVCVAGSRLLVQRSIHEEFVARLADIAGSMKVGDPLDLSSDIGAVASQAQLARDLALIDTGRSEGGRMVTGGTQVNQDSGGFYVAPTVFDNVSSDMTLAREEVFGPVLAVMPFEDMDDAISIANSTVYGLASAVWTSSLPTAHKMIRAIRAGVVHVNCYGGADMTVPLGGVKQSGNGHDKSLHAMDKYLDLKTAWINLG